MIDYRGYRGYDPEETLGYSGIDENSEVQLVMRFGRACVDIV